MDLIGRVRDEHLQTDQQAYEMWRDDNVESHGAKAAFMAGVRHGRVSADALEAVNKKIVCEFVARLVRDSDERRANIEARKQREKAAALPKLPSIS